MRDVQNSFLALWDLPEVEILISQFIIAEVNRHFPQAEHPSRLWQLVYRSHLIPDGVEVVLPAAITLPSKDRPILQSAIAARADLLITGDVKHVGPLFGCLMHGVLTEQTKVFKKRFPAHFPLEGVSL